MTTIFVCFFLCFLLTITEILKSRIVCDTTKHNLLPSYWCPFLISKKTSVIKIILTSYLCNLHIMQFFPRHFSDCQQQLFPCILIACKSRLSILLQKVVMLGDFRLPCAKKVLQSRCLLYYNIFLFVFTDQRTHF